MSVKQRKQLACVGIRTLSGVHFTNASLSLETQGKTALLQTNQTGIFLEQ
jgi:hypothetical protein